jgi:chondroitin AC lyase
MIVNFKSADFKISFRIALFTLFLFSINSFIFAEDDFDKILTKVKEDTVNKITKNSTIEEYIKHQKSNGSWDDIDYKDKSRSVWNPVKHLERIMNIAGLGYKTGWDKPESKEYKDSINLAVDFWLNEKLTSDNWWHNRIGAPQFICKILVLSSDQLSAKNKNALIDILKTQGEFQDKMTGTNRTWIAADNFILALVIRNEALLKSSLLALTEELHVTTEEGLQQDWSFHQHGPMLQTGNYGNSFLSTQIDLGLMLNSTKWAFTQSQIDLLSNYVLEHSQWPIWNIYYDIPACGRQMDFPGSLENKVKSLSGTALKLSRLDSTHSKELESISERFAKSTNEGSPAGIKYWWRSDYLIERADSWTVSLKMFSNRVMSVETNVNDENKLGAYLNDGSTWFRVTGDEYNDIQPVIDWRRIPGVTGIDIDDAVTPKLKTDYKTAGDLVGASVDQRFGTAAMDFKRDNIKVKKSWFFMPWGIVALGFDNRKTNENYFTSINQCKLRGNVLVWKNGTENEEIKKYSGNDLKGVWHDNIGYIIKDGQNTVLLAEERKGKWTDIRNMSVPKEEVKLPIFLFYMKESKNAVYEYAVVPDIRSKDFGTLINKVPYKLIENSNKLQAIEDTLNKFAGIIFWEKGEVNVLGINVKVDKPCILNLVLANNELLISLADPSQKLKQILVSVSGGWSGIFAKFDGEKTEINFTLPQNGMAGSTVKIKLKSKV